MCALRGVLIGRRIHGDCSRSCIPPDAMHRQQQVEMLQAAQITFFPRSFLLLLAFACKTLQRLLSSSCKAPSMARARVVKGGSQYSQFGFATSEHAALHSAKANITRTQIPFFRTSYIFLCLLKAARRPSWPVQGWLKGSQFSQFGLA